MYSAHTTTPPLSEGRGLAVKYQPTTDLQSQQLRGLPDTHGQQGQAERRKLSCPEKEGLHWSGLKVWLSQQTHLPDRPGCIENDGTTWCMWNCSHRVSTGHFGTVTSAATMTTCTRLKPPFKLPSILGGFSEIRNWASHFMTVNSFFTTLLFNKTKRTKEVQEDAHCPTWQAGMTSWYKGGQEKNINTWASQSHATKTCLNYLHKADTTGTRAAQVHMGS